MTANETYSEAKRQFSDRSRDVLMNVQSPHKWWSTLKSAVYASSSSLPPLVSDGGGLVRKSVGIADLRSDHFDNKQYREAVDLPLTCLQSPSLATFAFRSSEVRRLLLTLMVALTYWTCFLVFLRELLILWPSISVYCYGLFV